MHDMKSSNKIVITNAGVVRTKVAPVFFAYDILNVGINSFTNGSVNLLKQLVLGMTPDMTLFGMSFPSKEYLVSIRLVFAFVYG
jgi:hypothetical protein